MICRRVRRTAVGRGIFQAGCGSRRHSVNRHSLNLSMIIAKRVYRCFRPTNSSSLGDDLQSNSPRSYRELRLRNFRRDCLILETRSHMLRCQRERQ
jgi:hypothetical protein